MSGRDIINAILAGERDPVQLASLAQPNCKTPREEIAKALEGTWDTDLLFMLQQSIDAYDFFTNQTEECDKQIETLLVTYQARLDSDVNALVRHKRKKSARSKKTYRSNNHPLFCNSLCQHLLCISTRMSIDRSAIINTSEINNDYLFVSLVFNRF